MRRLSLRLYVVAVFIIMILLVTTLSTAFGVNQATNGIRDSVIARQRDAGVGAANNILYLLDSAERSLTSTASLISASDLRQPREDTIGPVLDPLVAFSREFAAAFLLDHTGRAVISRPPAQPTANVTFAGEPALVRASASAAPQLTLPAAPRRPFWIMQVPASAESARPYYVAGVLNTNLIENILFNNIDRSDQAVLLNEERLIIASTEPTLLPNVFAAWRPLERIEGGESDLEEGRAPTGQGPVLLTASSLRPEYAATVALMSPKSEITAIQAQLIQSAVATASVLALTAIVLGAFATSTITRPLEDVRRAAKKMSHGDLNVRAKPRGARELRELATDFNAMAENLSKEWEQRVELQNHLEDMVAQRTQELEAKRQEMELFFYGVSHDFKSPVISISNIVAMADEKLSEKEIDRAAVRDMIQRVRRSSAVLSRLTGELLQFAQAERAAPKYVDVDGDELLSTLVEEFRPQARERGIRLESRGKVGPIETDPDRLRHIVSNLVENALKYMPERAGSRVRVEWRRVLGQLEISVADNGLGIPQDLQKTLFRPFTRHDPRGAAVSGAGLGLSIVKRMTESLKGRVELDSTTDRGSTFRVRIPLQAPEADP